MAVVLLILGALAVTAGAAAVDWRAGLVVFGCLCLLAGADLARERTPSP